jgi:amino acid adenylation domain-containing protein
VIAHEDDSGDASPLRGSGKRLVAYVVLNKEQACAISELRGFLKQQLPEFMVPSAFVELDTLPVTASGKVDRKALAVSGYSRSEPAQDFVAPRTPIEELVAEIWAEVLELEQIGIHDNFFDLGGHSLLATRVNSRIRDALQLNMPLRMQFESPTIAELAERIEALRREAQGLNHQPIVVASRQDELRLSFSQERLWFLDQFEPGTSVYNMSGAYRVLARLDIGALERSLNEIVRRHEVLRTTFRNVEGAPRQVIAARLNVPLPVIDLSDPSSSAREAEAQRYSAEFARRPFDLSQGPLIRAALARLGEQEHIFLLSMHHIVSDGWSMEIFFRELSVLYDAYTNDQESPLAELPIQYADYAVWQRDWLRGDILESQLSYWRKQLANTSPLNLMTDRPRPPVQTFHGGRQSVVLSKELTQALKGISRKQGASLFMTLLAALQVLLHRLTAQHDIAVGSPIAGRNRAEVEGLIGFFLNSLVLRTDLSGDPAFLELLEQVRKVCLDAYAHQDVPFEKLLEELRPERDLSRTPFFQVFLNMVNVSPEHGQPAGLKFEPLSHGAEVESKFDLTIYVRAREGSLHLNCVYNTDLFDPERIQEMLSQYEALLTAISRDPSKNIHAFSLLTPSAKEQLPDPMAPLASDWMGSVHEKIAEHARFFPDRIALNDPSGSWSYAELNARSNQLAHHLLGNGIEREEIIAIYAHRSAALPLALLGVLKAGAAFLLLDPAYPPARLIQYVRSAKPRGFISLEAAGVVPQDLQEVLQETTCFRISLPQLARTGTENRLGQHSAHNPEIEIRPDDLAYISYTSGSTGEPKGVMGRHGPLSHFLPWQAAHFDLTAADRFSLLSGLSHDPLHREILTALWVGGTLCVPEPDVIGASGDLAEWMAGQQITFAHLTPALGRLLADGAKPDCKIPSLRYAFFIGDKLTRRDLSCLRRLAPQVINVNYYGSTETQRAVSYQELSPETEEGPGGSVVPVGRGMPGAQLLVLTQAQKLTGIGEVGEIYMRSPHLARGYLSDPALTHGRFITNPFTGQPNDRMYRTGDLGRYLGDGTVEVLGRIDGQVSIRGFRIETGEVEFVLSQCPAVRDAVVIARDDTDGDKKLIAYIIAAHASAPSGQELRSFLKQRLPEHMMPSAFVLVESLPLTPNGKVDRGALPGPDSTRHDQGTAPVAPRDRLELQLREIWQKVLRRPLGVRDNFFDQGGHSLLAVRLFAQIEKITGIRLPVAALFHAPTIEQLAKLMSEQGWSDQWKSLVAIQPGGSRSPFFCVHAHDGGVLFWRDLARYLGPDRPFYALQPRGLDGLEPLHTTIEEMAAHYVQEIRSLQPEGPYYIGGHCIGGLIAFEMAQQLYALGERVAFLAVIDSFAPARQVSKRRSLFRRCRYRAISLFERTVTLHFGNLSVLKPSEWLSYVKGKIDKALYKLYMGLGARWVPEARTRQNILKAGSRASRAYKPRVYPGKITLFRATDLGGGIEHDPKMGWGRLAGGELEMHLVPGYHAHIVLEPRVRLLAKELSRSLDEAQHADQSMNEDKSARSAAPTESIVSPNCNAPVSRRLPPTEV